MTGYFFLPPAMLRLDPEPDLEPPETPPLEALWPRPEELPVLMLERDDPTARYPELKVSRAAPWEEKVAPRRRESPYVVACPSPRCPELPFHLSQSCPLLDLPEGKGTGLGLPTTFWRWCPVEYPLAIDLTSSG